MKVLETHFIGDYLRVNCKLHGKAVNPIICNLCKHFVGMKKRKMKRDDIVCGYEK